MSKVKSGQSQLLIPLIVILTSALVFATNTYINATNSTQTGEFLVKQQVEERNFSIEVWANTSIRLESDEKFVRAVLALDNGILLKNQQVDFYLNGSSIYNVFTNSEGVAEIPRSDNGNIRAIFNGNPSLFFNPSQGEIEVINIVNVTNITENFKPTFDIISDKTVKIGNLEITIFNISEDSYKTLDLDENYERIEQKYYKVYIEVFNNFSRIPGIYTLEDNEVIDIFLEDNLENSYEQDNEILFFLSSLNLFGNSMEISPSTGREGYLIFSETEGTPEKLIVKIKSGAEAEFRLR